MVGEKECQKNKDSIEWNCGNNASKLLRKGTFDECIYRSEYIEFLNNKFAELGIGKYAKNMENIFDVLLEYGNPKLAIRYAKRIISEHQGMTPTMIAPGTKVYELVEELVKYLPEEMKEKFVEEYNGSGYKYTKNKITEMR